MSISSDFLFSSQFVSSQRQASHARSLATSRHANIDSPSIEFHSQVHRRGISYPFHGGGIPDER